MKRRTRGIAVVTTLLGGLLGSYVYLPETAETHSHMQRVRLGQVAHANWTIGLALVGAILGIAADLKTGGLPIDKRDWQFGTKTRLPILLVFVFLCFGLHCYWEILFAWP